MQSLSSKIVVAVSVLLVSLSGFSQTEKTMEEYWEGTILMPLLQQNFGPMFTRGKPSACYQKLETFSGCFEIINILAKSMQKIMVPVAYSKDSDFEAGALQEQLNEVGIYQFVARPEEDTKLSFRSRWEARDGLRLKIKKAHEELFSSPNKIDFAEVMDKVFKDFQKQVEGKKQNFVLAQAFNAYVVTAVDAHGRIAPTQEFADKRESADQNISGIGMEFNGKTNEVMGIIPGGPAEKDGRLKANDIVTHVNDIPVTDLKPDVVSNIRGPDGTEVKLTISRDGQTMEIKLVRAKVKLEGVRSRMVESFGQKIAHIRFRQFAGKDLCDKIRSSVMEKEVEGAKGIVLDMRSNPGGELGLAVCIGGIFLGKKEIVITKNLITKQFEKNPMNTSLVEKVTDLPVVVLLNRGSASASELVGGALRDYDRALVIGEQSFGKGSVQSASPLAISNQTILFFRTTNYFYQPGGTTNQITGIFPDIAIPIKPDATEDDMFAVREAQIYPNALPAEGGTWTPSEKRAAVVAQVKNCIDQGKLAEAKYFADPKKDQAADMYPVHVAEEALACQAKLNIRLEVVDQPVKKN
ncbi:MAG: PDZ domain-containing protein [Bdellovibrionales bacterium]|nr:PDZ domain-containing protein [Bdellovibrionales bacterium]